MPPPVRATPIAAHVVSWSVTCARAPVGGEVGNGLYEYTMDADDSPGAGYYWAEFVTDSTDVDSRTVTDYIYIVGEGYRMRHGKHFTDQVQQPYRDTQFDTNLTGE